MRDIEFLKARRQPHLSEESYLYDIDDSGYSDELVYPKDLIDFARSTPRFAPTLGATDDARRAQVIRTGNRSTTSRIAIVLGMRFLSLEI